MQSPSVIPEVLCTATVTASCFDVYKGYKVVKSSSTPVLKDNLVF